MIEIIIFIVIIIMIIMIIIIVMIIKRYLHHRYLRSRTICIQDKLGALWDSVNRFLLRFL